MLALVAVALTLAAVAAATAPTPSSERRPARPWWLPSVLETLRPADGLGAITAAWGDAWMDDRWGGRLLRLDGGDGRVLARIPVDGRLALGAGAGAVWALESGGGYGRALRGPLVRVDPRTNRVAARIPLRTTGGRPVLGFGVVAGDGAVWVWGPMDVLRIDPRSNAVVQSFAITGTRGMLTGAAPAGGQLVATTADGRIKRFGARTGTHGAITAAAETAAELRAATGSRLVLTTAGAMLAADAATGRVIWRRPLGFRVGSVLTRGDVLLAHGAGLGDAGDRVWALDARTGRVLNSVLLPAFGTAAMAGVGDALWVTSAGGAVVVIPRWLNDRLQAG